MATAGFILTTLQARMRDTSGTAFSVLVPPTVADGTTQGIAMVNQAQILINALEEQYVVSTPYSLTKNTQLVGPVSLDATLGSVVVRIKGIRQGNADVPFMPFRQLHQVDREWFGRTGDHLQAWTMFGRDLLILYPALRVTTSINVISVAYTPTLTLTTDLITLSDDMVPQILDVAELLACIRLRQVDRIKMVMSRLEEHYKEELSDDSYMKKIGNLV